MSEQFQKVAQVLSGWRLRAILDDPKLKHSLGAVWKVQISEKYSGLKSAEVKTHAQNVLFCEKAFISVKIC